MSFLASKEKSGGFRQSKRRLLMQIEDLNGKIDEEFKKREELSAALCRTERAIGHWRALLKEMEASL